MPEIPKNFSMEDNLKPGHGEGVLEWNQEVSSLRSAVVKDNRKKRAAKEEDGTRTDQWGVYCTMK